MGFETSAQFTLENITYSLSEVPLDLSFDDDVSSDIEIYISYTLTAYEPTTASIYEDIQYEYFASNQADLGAVIMEL
jgi:hypothetical protein